MEKTENFKRSLKIDQRDNVATAVMDVEPGDRIEVQIFGGTELILTAVNTIPFGHKVALENIDLNESVIKYGASIGIATASISIGEQVHTHNLGSARAVEHG